MVEIAKTQEDLLQELVHSGNRLYLVEVLINATVEFITSLEEGLCDDISSSVYTDSSNLNSSNVTTSS
jgi:hypothetical protein